MSPCTMCGYDPTAKPRKKWEFTAQSYAPSVNQLKSNDRGSHKYRKWRKTWEELFGEWLKTIPVAAEKRRITITRLYGDGKRAYDRVNYAAGCKPLLDTAVTYGALYDDNAMWAEDHYVQTKSADGIDYVLVCIEEM